MSTELIAIIISLSIISGLATILVSIIFETENKTKISNKLLLCGSILTVVGIVILYLTLKAVNNADITKAELIDTIVEEYEIIKIDDSNIYTYDEHVVEYTNPDTDILIFENNSENAFKVVKESKKYLLDTFIESYDIKVRYTVYIDKETKDIMENIIEKQGLIWKK